jgi:hypothetical protein
VAIKGFEVFNTGEAKVWVPVAVSVDDLETRIELEASLNTRLLNIIFHGVGGDHLSVSAETHEQLLVYLAANQDRYTLGTYIDLMHTLYKEDSPKH